MYLYITKTYTRSLELIFTPGPIELLRAIFPIKTPLADAGYNFFNSSNSAEALALILLVSKLTFPILP